MRRTVVVVGAGNAALCAALSAREAGCDVTVLERAPEKFRGGNSAFTAGAMRVAYRGVEDLRTLMPDLTESQIAKTDFGSYPAEQFMDDLAKVTEYRCDPDLAEILVYRSLETLQWMVSHGVRILPRYGRQAYEFNGKFTFWGGLTIEISGGGRGLIEMLTKACLRSGVRIRYGARAVRLLSDGSRINGVAVMSGSAEEIVTSDAVILACGGFEANAEWRARYLGPNWDLAKVRGTSYNTGDGLLMALQAGASSSGHWSGCHSVAWERNAPEFGDLEIGDQFQKHSYPFSIMINSRGERFVDEGADFRNYTYAKYGRAILEQPGQFAWQVYDQNTAWLLSDDYAIRQVTKVQADTLEKLATAMDGVDADAFLATVRQYNQSVVTKTPLNPNIKDGRHTIGISPPKSNWATVLDKPPYLAFAVTCGITFTFGGLRINKDAQVLDAEMNPMPGLFAAGEIVGGIFYFNYPGGAGLTSGSVFGRIAGARAATTS